MFHPDTRTAGPVPSDLGLGLAASETIGEFMKLSPRKSEVSTSSARQYIFIAIEHNNNKAFQSG